MPARTLTDYLKSAGLNMTVPESEKVAAPVAPPVAPIAPVAPVAQPKTAAAPAPVKEAPKKVAAPEKRAAVEYDPEAFKTAEQQVLMEHGIVIPDPEMAAHFYRQQVELANEAKTAQVEELAEQERCKGALQYHGMLKESYAMRYAAGETSIQDVVKVASWIGVSSNAILHRANQIKAATPQFDGMDAAQPHSALLGNAPATPARQGSSETMSAAAQNNNTTNYEPEASSGTRKATTGQDENLKRFVDKYTLPGNPGLNHGQATDQGKGYSS